MKILEALHDSALAATMISVLEDMGHECKRADSLVRAQGFLEEQVFDCILMDLFPLAAGITMKAMDASKQEDYVGYVWALEVLKEYPEMKGKIIIYSSFLSGLDRNKFDNVYAKKAEGIHLVSMTRSAEYVIDIIKNIESMLNEPK